MRNLQKTVKNQNFLFNVADKYKFVLIIFQYLPRDGINTKVATQDAGALRAQTALDLNDRYELVIVTYLIINY